ncbi:transcriptional regulator with XRE-family HTH domain [Streptosporangium album]|uniref:Transcriptional regulator with XRE-family HTH domain n=1 Tax=Streptosporangium album TaxID=47479 RepID=A0A7W7W7J6_9ACTN|nr:helix-turn-helix transcriptional regulator [Streptosporangium album]MBB4936811.1 transcriptional regulator with XRE-family HTH domain [Streptosporangium album]
MDSEAPHPLGAFLRARRAQLRPEQVGLAIQGRRQVPGLRREEVARLAGISVGHYIRLEQGRELHPTEQTVKALAHALRLDEAAVVELHRLARPVQRRRRPNRVERVGQRVIRLLNDWSSAPAYVLGRSQDVLARNPLAEVLHSRFTFGDNMLHMIFLDPAGREYFRDWDLSARAAVHDLRQLAREAPQEQRVRELIGELSISSADFRRLWAGREPRGAMVQGSRFFHPDVGELHLKSEVFPIASAPGQRLIAQPAEPGFRSAEALAMLSTLAVQH